MKRLRTDLLVACMTLAVLAGHYVCHAQHLDVLVQQADGALVTGSANFDTTLWTLGRRVFFSEFLIEDFTTDGPGFNARPAGSPSLPPGSQALPGNTDLGWDFLPMTIGDVTANLFYWDGIDSDGHPGLTPADVHFGAPPGPSYTLSLFGRQNLKFTVDGSDQFVPGGVIDRTASDGWVHMHRFFYLEDGGAGGNQPADGIYLVAMQLRMSGLVNSLPIFVVFGTPGSSVASLDNAAVPWVESRADALVPPILPGDYNNDGVVDAADYIVWRKTLAQSALWRGAGADGDRSGTVDNEDYAVWRTSFGLAREASGGGSEITLGADHRASWRAGVVPEPSTALLAAASIIFVLLFKRTSRSVQREDFECSVSNLVI